MALTQDTFDSVNIGYLRLVEPEGSPQRIQRDEFSGVDGGKDTTHGKRPRQLVFSGFVQDSTPAACANAIGVIQALINRNLKTLVHVLANGTTTYTNCRLEDYRRVGAFGRVTPNAGNFVVAVRATFTQLYW